MRWVTLSKNTGLFWQSCVNGGKMKRERASIFGLGYVGLTNAACLAEMGHRVIGVDIKPEKVDSLNQGQSPVTEEGLGSRICEAVKCGLLSATTDVEAAVLGSDISLVCVGTPPDSSGSIDLTSIVRVAEQIGIALRSKNDYHLVVIRSTVVPSTTSTTVVPLLGKSSARTVGADFGVCVNPEFLREGSMVEDFMNPGIIVVGELDARSGDLLQRLYCGIDAAIYRVDIKTAEMVKYSFNAFHALKISFINEIGNICQAHGIDTHVVSQILCSDRKLNISPRYLSPGFAFGGSCLPKDLRAMINQSRRVGYTPYLMESVLRVNDVQKERALSTIRGIVGVDSEERTIAIVGAAFKENTDDIRESPAVQLIGELTDSKWKIRVYDPLALDNLRCCFGDRVEYSTSLADTLSGADLCVLTLNYIGVDELTGLIHLMNRKNVLDLAGISGYEHLREMAGVNYFAICW